MVPHVLVMHTIQWSGRSDAAFVTFEVWEILYNEAITS